MDVKRGRTASDGTQGPMKEKQPGMGPKDPWKKNSQRWDPRTHERKGSADSRQSSGLIVREMGKDAFENPRCVRESDVSYQGEEARIERPCW